MVGHIITMQQCEGWHPFSCGVEAGDPAWSALNGQALRSASRRRLLVQSSYACWTPRLNQGSVSKQT